MQEYTVKIYDNGTKYWYQDDKLHRLDGPAVEWTDGSKFWYQNGERHRLDGPAAECANGYKYWYIEGVYYTEEEFNRKVNPTNKVVSTKELTVEEISQLLGYEVKVVKG